MPKFTLRFMFLCLALIAVLFSTSFMLGCSGDDDDDDSNNDDNNQTDLSGTWNVSYTVQIDTCYGYSPGTQLSDTWQITQNGNSITVVDSEGDHFTGSINGTSNTFTASYSDTQQNGDCITTAAAIISCNINAQDENMLSGALIAQVDVNDPAACGYDDCVTQNLLSATR